jgi:hypothetical protein
MTQSARELLSAFEALPPSEQQELAAEILRRSAGRGELTDDTLDDLAAELFRSYDAEETSGGH